MFAFERFPVPQRLLKLLTIGLDPFAAQENQALTRFEQLPAFGVGERLAVEGQFDLKIEELVEAERADGALANVDVNLRPRRFAGRPPIGNSDDDPALLDAGRLDQKAMRLTNRPCLRREELFAFEQFAGPGPLCSASRAHGFQQRIQPDLFPCRRHMS